MKRLNDNPTRVEELAHWAAFLNSLPVGCYLDMALKGSAERLKADMENDVSNELVQGLGRGKVWLDVIQEHESAAACSLFV